MQRHVIIGDVHGCFAELQELLEIVGLSAEDVVVSVGDLVDRGPDSAAVVRLFRERPNSQVIVGNHERKHIRGIFSYAQEITRLQLGDTYAEAVQWMGSLPYFLELDCAIVVHAAVEPGRPLAEQRPEILCGSTSGEKELEGLLGGAWWHERYAGPKPVVFGHHVVDEPLIRPGVIYGIDTGACFGGRLTALTLPDFRIYSVAAREDHWKRVKRVWQADVLAAKPWSAMTWRELDDHLERFGRVDEPRNRAYIEALRAWRDALDGRVDAMLSAILREAAQLEAEAGVAGRTALAKTHALSKFLFQAFRGRLDREALLQQIHTPNGLAAVGAALGLKPLTIPAPAPS